MPKHHSAPQKNPTAPRTRSTREHEFPMNKIAILATLSLSIGLAAATNAADDFHWPRHAEAAVCLTYDDSIDSQLDVALPQLNQYGLPGTFFINASSASMANRLDEWTAIGETQHELASHSAYHPCRASGPGRSWVQPESDLDHYTLKRMTSELDLNNTFLKALDHKSIRTFAYPCGDFVLNEGNDSYKPVVESKFVAARGVGHDITPIKELSFYETPTLNGADKTVEEMVAYIEDAAQQGTVATIMFHGVGGDYLTVNGEEHRKLLAYLADNKDRLWTATYLDAMSHARSEFKRLGWTAKP